MDPNSRGTFIGNASTELVCHGSVRSVTFLQLERSFVLKVFVRDNNVEQALRVLKKKLQREGFFREIKRRRAYEKPSEKRVRERREGIRRGKKAARKLAEREGLLPDSRTERPAFGRR